MRDPFEIFQDVNLYDMFPYNQDEEEIDYPNEQVEDDYSPDLDEDGGAEE